MPRVNAVGQRRIYELWLLRSVNDSPIDVHVSISCDPASAERHIQRVGKVLAASSGGMAVSLANPYVHDNSVSESG